MNKSFKRIVSSVLSFTMLLGCVVTANTSAVSAAETVIAEYDFSTADSGYITAPADIVNITGTTVTTGSVDENTDLTINKSGGGQDAHGFRLNGGNEMILRNLRGGSEKTAPVKITLGGCSWGSTFTVSDGGEFEKSGLSNNIGACWHSNKTANVFNIYYDGSAQSLKLTAAGQIYISYIKVSTVSAEEYKVAIIPSSVVIEGSDTIAVGGTSELKAVLSPTNVYPFVDTLTWSTSDESVASVTDGVVTGVGAGTAVITAASTENSDIKGTMTVTVVDSSTKYVVSGKITGVGADRVASVKIGDTAADIDVENSQYSAKVVPGTYDVTASDVEGYTLSSLSKESLIVSGDTERNIHYKKDAVAATDTKVYVDGSANGENHYDTITQAIAGLKKGNKKSGSTVVLTPGKVYEEQVIVDVPNVKFYCEDKTNLPTVQWYYGIGQTYYSADSTGFYNEEYAYDKQKRSKVDRWGCAVRVTSSGFSAENVIFKNTFNYEVTQSELDDGVTRNANAYGENTGGVSRTSITQDVQTTSATERAAAIALDADNAAFENCQFLGSQDTVYSQYNAYFKNCLISGQTDYMFNNSGTVIVDDSVLQWKGYSDSAKAGYITAARGKYIFRNCEIKASDSLKTTKGYYGRPWANTADVSFIGCKTNGLIDDAGWTSMSGVNPSSSMFKENSNTTDGTTKFNSAINASDSEIGTDDDPTKDYNYFTAGWVPFNHIAYATSEKSYTFDFTVDDGLNISGTGTYDKASADGAASVILDANGSYIKFHSAQYGNYFKSGSQIKFYVTSEQSDKVPVKATFVQTANAINAAVYKADDMQMALSSVDISGPGSYELEFDADSGAEYVIVFSDYQNLNNVYLSKMMIATKGDILSALPKSTKTATWDFQNGNPESIKDVNIQGVDASGTVASDISGVELGVEAAKEGAYTKLVYSTNGSDYFAQYNVDTLVKIPVMSEGDIITVVSYPGQYAYTVGGTAATSNTTVYTATAADKAKGYVEMVATSQAYLYSISLEYTESENALGDVNKDGKINKDDAEAILRLAYGVDNDYDSDAADVDGNGSVDVIDAILYLQRLPETAANQ